MGKRLPILLALLSGLALAACAPAGDGLSGLVRATEYRLGSRVGGVVAAHLVEEGQVVSAGTPVARLDDRVLAAQRRVLVAAVEAARAAYADLKAGATAEDLRRARAELAGAEAQYAQALAGFRSEDIRAAVSQRDALAANLENASTNAERMENLLAAGVVSPKDRDAAVAARDALRSQMAAAQANVDKLTRGLRPEEIAAAQAAVEARQAVLDRMRAGPTPNQLAAAEARLRQAEEQLAALELDLADLIVVAPADGLVEERLLDAGETAAPGAALLSFISTQDMWIDTFVPESKLSAVKLGTRMRVVLDAVRNQPFEAEVFFISRQAEFTPRNLSTPEERVNQVYRVKLRPLSPPVELRSGMTASVFAAR